MFEADVFELKPSGAISFTCCTLGILQSIILALIITVQAFMIITWLQQLNHLHQNSLTLLCRVSSYRLPWYKAWHFNSSRALQFPRVDNYWHGKCTEIKIILKQQPPLNRSLILNEFLGEPKQSRQSWRRRRQPALTDVLSGPRLISPDAEARGLWGTGVDQMRTDDGVSHTKCRNHTYTCISASGSAAL